MYCVVGVFYEPCFRCQYSDVCVTIQFQMGAGYTGGLNDTKQREMVAIIPAGASLDIQIPTSIRGEAT